MSVISDRKTETNQPGVDVEAVELKKVEGIQAQKALEVQEVGNTPHFIQRGIKFIRRLLNR